MNGKYFLRASAQRATCEDVLRISDLVRREIVQFDNSTVLQFYNVDS
jgi:hypothetical protein